MPIKVTRPFSSLGWLVGHVLVLAFAAADTFAAFIAVIPALKIYNADKASQFPSKQYRSNSAAVSVEHRFTTLQGEYACFTRSLSF
ncbi:MAG: hypothetical protein HY081_03660 [Gammaproteobacteria bacterium]|nr:hypothetical protein [Gammaproteobacteria bacterium]